ncbi:MAG: addiction module protein [Verrucomicrobiales bacterium]
MIAERFPALLELNPEEQMLLAGELVSSTTKETGRFPELSDDILQALEERLDAFFLDPGSGISWEELRERIKP